MARSKKSVKAPHKPKKKSFNVQVIDILDTLAKREVGADVMIAQLKADYGEPEEQEQPEEEETTEETPA